MVSSASITKITKTTKSTILKSPKKSFVSYHSSVETHCSSRDRRSAVTGANCRAALLFCGEATCVVGVAMVLVVLTIRCSWKSCFSAEKLSGP